MPKRLRPYHLTPSEETIMNILWGSKEPLTQQQIITEATKQESLNFKDRSIFSLLNALVAKNLIAGVGFARSGKTYARTFVATMSRPEYYAHMVNDLLSDKEVVEFKRALKALRKPATEEE